MQFVDAIRCCPPEGRAIDVELPAGGVAFFAYGTPHATRPNTTDHERAGVAFHFLRADYAQDELIQPDRDYRPYLTGPRPPAAFASMRNRWRARGSG